MGLYPLKTLQSISKYGLKILVDYPELLIQVHPTFSNLLYLSNVSKDCIYSPQKEILMECEGLIFDLSTGLIVNYALPKIPNYQEGYERFNWKGKFQIYEKIDGYFGFLYYWNNEWNVGSKCKKKFSIFVKIYFVFLLS